MTAVFALCAVTLLVLATSGFGGPVVIGWSVVFGVGCVLLAVLEWRGVPMTAPDTVPPAEQPDPEP